MNNVLLENNYEYKPYEFMCGSPLYKKNIKKGIIFYFPIGHGFYSLLIRNIKGRYLEDLFSNVIHESILTENLLKDNEQYLINNTK